MRSDNHTNRKKNPLASKSIDTFRSMLNGQVLQPEDAEYDRHRKIWNGMIDRRPALIARCLNTEDVVLSIRFANDNGLLVAVHGGGHNVAGNAVCDGGLMIDLSQMRSVDVDPGSGRVRAAPGCLLSDLDNATQQHGLAVPAGIVSHTGVAGLTLGGGFGWISRKHGLTVDRLLSVEIVNADGDVMNASPDENAELFWGSQGGSGNFGIATRFEYQAVEIGTEVYSGLIIQRFEEAKSYLRFHSEYVRSLPDEMTIWIVVRHAPPLPFLDAGVHGRLVVAVAFCYLGEPAQGEKLIQPLRNFGTPHGEAIGMNPWVGWQSGFDGLVEHGARNYWKSHHLTELSDGCIEEILSAAAHMPSEHMEIMIPHMEGAPSRVPEDATAYSFRKSPFILNIHGRWVDPKDDDRCMTWTRNLFEKTKPYAHGVYVNFLSQEGENRVKEAYAPDVWKRLVALKNRYDPRNVFRMNQNIQPSR